MGIRDGFKLGNELLIAVGEQLGAQVGSQDDEFVGMLVDKIVDDPLGK